MRIALAQIDTTVGDLLGNERLVSRAIERASAEGVELLLLPEMVLCGYPAKDLLERDDFVQDTLAVLERIAATCTGTCALVGHVDFNRSSAGRRLHNSITLCGQGRRLATIHKTLLPTYDVFDEARFFEPAPSRKVLQLPLPPAGAGGRGGDDGGAPPLRIAVTVCEDLWAMHGLPERRPYAVDPLDELLEQAPQLIVNLSASPFSLGKLEERSAVMRAQVARAGLPLAYCNLVGANDGVIFDGCGMVMNERGELVKSLAPFAEDFAVVDLPLPEGPPPRRAADVSRVQVPAGEGASAGPCSPAGGEEEQGYRALCLGVRDYMAKTGFSRAVIGLSGGIDSALVATIAVDAIGPEQVLGLSMPSAISSEHSRTDAKDLARNLGIELWEVPIAPAMEAYEALLAPHFQGLPADVTEENFQARIRGNMLMGVSNKLGHLLLSTGNKSELAVGYCTLYGDMSGGLSVLADVPKTLVYRIARWVNRERERIPEHTITKPPSAELRPDQLDQDSLPDYDLLDAVMRAYVEEHLSVEAIAARGLPLEIIRKVVGMIDRQEYKRHQTAPVLRITTRAFGTGRRYPVVQRYDPFLRTDGRLRSPGSDTGELDDSRARHPERSSS